MSHKDKCKKFCTDHLESRGLSSFFSSPAFDSFYRKVDGANGNAFSVGLKAADVLILQQHPQTLKTAAV